LVLSFFTTGSRCRGSFRSNRITLSRPRFESRDAVGVVFVVVVVVVVLVVTDFEVVDDVPEAGVFASALGVESPGAGFTVSRGGSADDAVSARSFLVVHAARTASATSATRVLT
jgi:hypothetical protein